VQDDCRERGEGQLIANECLPLEDAVLVSAQRRVSPST
jgi:hypothetical protein